MMYNPLDFILRCQQLQQYYDDILYEQHTLYSTSGERYASSDGRYASSDGRYASSDGRYYRQNFSLKLHHIKKHLRRHTTGLDTNVHCRTSSAYRSEMVNFKLGFLLLF